MTHLLQRIDDSSIATDGSFVGNTIYRARVANAILFNSRNHGHKSDPTVDLIKRELLGTIGIKRETPTGGADDVATDVGIDVDVDVNIGVDISDVGAKSGGEHVDDVGDIYGGFTPSRAIHSIED
ncbi:hypothetical protein KY289_026857 [Solanum tuberosum]|nr:hypothetical protein KY289_026857 [Solanum tuberosum]